MEVDSPTLIDLDRAHEAFRAREPRDLFYRAATELTDLALRGSTSLTLAEALAVLLQTWNKSYYQYKRFDSQHFIDIETLVRDNSAALARYRGRFIDKHVDSDDPEIEQIFQDFERVLGPVGAAKVLHVLAPRWFPLWDRKIADAYGLNLGRAGTNGRRYRLFMTICRKQIGNLGGVEGVGSNPLKALDEYNYCRYTKRWIER